MSGNAVSTRGAAAKAARKVADPAPAKRKAPIAAQARKTAKKKATSIKPAPTPKPKKVSKPVLDQINQRLRDGTFAPGNRLWEARSSAGPKPTFATPESLWSACVEYFEWASDNPLAEAKLFPTKEQIRVELLPKLRAMTITGLCLFIDISKSTWDEWKAAGGPHYRADLSGVIERVESIIFEQKFSAASVGLLNPNIIARDLGLADKNEITGKDGAPIQHVVKARVVMVPPKKPATVETRPMPSEEEA